MAGPLQDQPEWRLIPAIWLTALGPMARRRRHLGYPGFYPQDEAHLDLYLKSARDAGRPSPVP